MFKNKAILLFVSALLALPGAIQAQGVTPTAAGKGGTVTTEGLVKRYQGLAGGEGNATSLVNGLRTGADITLTGITTETVTVTKDVPVYEEVPVYATKTTTAPCVPFKIGPNGLPVMCTTTTQVQTGTEQKLVRTDHITTTETVTKPVTLTFSPGPAAPMGFGNVDIAIALTEAKLNPNAAPNPVQLRDALMEILNKRAGGQGWGEIANAYGFQLK